MTIWSCLLNLTPNGYTLHLLSDYLSLVGLALCFGSFIAVIYEIATRQRRIVNEHSTLMEKNSTVMPDKSGIHGPPWDAVKRHSRSNTIPTQTRGA